MTYTGFKKILFGRGELLWNNHTNIGAVPSVNKVDYKTRDKIKLYIIRKNIVLK